MSQPSRYDFSEGRIDDEADECTSDYDEGIRFCRYCESEVDYDSWVEQGELCDECYDESQIDWSGVR